MKLTERTQSRLYLYGEKKKGKKIRKIKIQNLKESMLIIIVLHLYNLGIMVDESIYKIKKIEKCKT